MNASREVNSDHINFAISAVLLCAKLFTLLAHWNLRLSHRRGRELHFCWFTMVSLNSISVKIPHLNTSWECLDLTLIPGSHDHRIYSELYSGSEVTYSRPYIENLCPQNWSLGLTRLQSIEVALVALRLSGDTL